MALPQWLHIAHRIQIAEYPGIAISVLETIERVMAAIRAQRVDHRFRREHSSLHRIMRALDARNVHEPSGTTNQRSTRKAEFRHRLHATFGNRPRAIGNAPAVLKHGSN